MKTDPIPRILLEMALAASLMLVVPVFLIAVNVRWVINFPPLYSYGFDRYGIENYTGIERDELISAGRQIRTYFNDDTEFIAIRVTIPPGVVVDNLFNEREVHHMRDVKALVQGVYRVSEITAAYIAIVLIAGFALRRRAFCETVGGVLMRWGGLTTLILVALVGLISLLFFDQVFLLFHLVSFANDLWQLDPRRDYLIAMFPQSFFLDAVLLIAFAVIAQAAILAALSGWVKGLAKPKEDGRRA